MNQVAPVGNIIDDPELRYTQSGAGFANFTVAVGHRLVPPSTVLTSLRALSGGGSGFVREVSGEMQLLMTDKRALVLRFLPNRRRS